MSDIIQDSPSTEPPTPSSETSPKLISLRLVGNIHGKGVSSQGAHEAAEKALLELMDKFEVGYINVALVRW